MKTLLKILLLIFVLPLAFVCGLIVGCFMIFYHAIDLTISVYKDIVGVQQ